MFALRQADTDVTVAKVCRKMGINEATYYNLKKKYGGLGVPALRRLKQLEEENQHLKQLLADLSLDKQLRQEVQPDRGGQYVGNAYRPCCATPKPRSRTAAAASATDNAQGESLWSRLKTEELEARD